MNTHIYVHIYVYVFDIYKRIYKFAISVSKQKDSRLNYFVLNVRPLSFHNFRQLIMFSEPLKLIICVCDDYDNKGDN